MIEYKPNYFQKSGADDLFKVFQALPFTQREVVVWEKRHKLPRLTCFFDDRGTGYKYSNQETPAEKWTTELLEIREMLEQIADCQFGACLVNFYRDGQDCVGFHRDNDHIFGSKSIIASVSLGASRKFKLRKCDKAEDGSREKLEFILNHRDLLIFSDEHVKQWEHSVPRTAKPTESRINLTFRSTN